jgi:hypothetical protein
MALKVVLCLLWFAAQVAIGEGYSINCTSLPVKPDYNLCSLSKDNCNVESGVAVDLVCAVCPPGFKETQWFKWNNAAKQYQHLTEFDGNGTITFPANEVDSHLTSCYKCYCDYDSQEFAALIGLIVKPWSGKPYLIVPNTPEGNDTYQLSAVNGSLTVVDRGRVCIDAFCKGNETIYYSWYKLNSTRDDYDPIQDYKDKECYFDGNLSRPLTNLSSTLCFLPTVYDLCTERHTKQSYKVIVSNEVGNITAFADVIFPDVSQCGIWSWFVRPHEKQSHEQVFINNGTGKAYCAAYHEDPRTDIRYSVYVEDVSVNLGLEACHLLSMCGKNCNEHICDQNKSDEDRHVDGYSINCSQALILNHLGMKTWGAVVTVKEPNPGQKFVCVAKRALRNQNSASSQDQAWSDPMVLGTFEFFNPTQPDPRPSTDTNTSQLPTSILPAVGVLLILVAVFTVILGTILGYQKWKKKREQRVLAVQESIHGDANDDDEEHGLVEGSDTTPLTSLSSSIRQHSVLGYGSTQPSAAIAIAGSRSSHDKEIETSLSVSASITDSQTNQKVAEIDLNTPTNSNVGSTVSKVYLPPGRQYDFGLDEGGRTISIFTDIIKDFPRRATPEDLAQLPTLIEKIVPISLPILLDFVGKMAAGWDRIGIKLDMGDKVAELRAKGDSLFTNLTVLFEVWINRGRDVSWIHLLRALESPGVDMAAAADDIRDFLCKQVPEIPDNIDFLCPMSVKDLMPLVSPCADQWEMIGELLKLDEEVDTLKKTALSSYVKMTMIFEAWAKHKKEFSWLNLLEQVKSKQELLPLVSDIKQYLTQMVRKLYGDLPASAT